MKLGIPAIPNRGVSRGVSRGVRAKHGLHSGTTSKPGAGFDKDDANPNQAVEKTHGQP